MKWLCVITCSIFVLLFAVQGNCYEYKLFVKNIFGTETRELTLGYDQWGTDGIDTALGEFPLPPYTQQFDARFRLPADTSITTYKDIRFGCGLVYSYNYIIEWKNTSGVTIMGDSWNNNNYPLIDIFLIDPSSGNTLAHFQRYYNDSVYYVVPSNISRILVRTYNNIPLSHTSYSLTSLKGGEVLQSGSNYIITWEVSLPSPSGVNIELSTNGGVSWGYVTQNISGLLSSYNWTVPNINSNNCLISVGSRPCVYDKSAGNFIIYQDVPPQLQPVEYLVTLKNGTGIIKELTLGMDPNATNGLDTLLGEKSISLLSAGNFDGAVRLGLGQGSNILSVKDYQPGFNIYHGEKDYILALQPSADSVISISVNLPLGVSSRLRYSLNMSGYYALIDTILGQGYINYTFPRNTAFNDPNRIRFICQFDLPTPVELNSFNAVSSDNSVLLKWNTTSEKNNKGFGILRKIDGETNWQTISFITGSGTTTEKNSYIYTDKRLNPGKYFYRLNQIDFDGSSRYSNTIEVVAKNPVNYELSQNYPNPFNPTTSINYSLPKAGNVKLTIYNAIGSKVATVVNEYKPAGNYSVQFNASNLASGIYLYRLESGNYSAVKKFILLK